MAIKSSIQFYFNGKKITVHSDYLIKMTARFLRESLLATGTKIVCEEGDCGACTCLIADPLDKSPQFIPINTCILPVFSLDGKVLVSVEGLATEKNLHPVQESFIKCFGSQCGYCTPGMVCSSVGFVEKTLSQKKNISEKSIKNALTGNLCRCTGYEPIINSVLNVDLKSVTSLKKRYSSCLNDRTFIIESKKSLLINNKDFTLFLPNSLSLAIAYKKKFPKTKIIAGATDLGVLYNKQKDSPVHIMSLSKISTLDSCEVNNGKLIVGSRCSLTLLENKVETIFPEFHELLKIFASPQIKNSGTLIGNLLNASPIGDTIPFMLVNDSYIVARSTNKKRNIALRELYLGYKKLNLKPSEIVTHLVMPINKKTKFKLYKASTRKDLDISTVTMGFSFTKQNDIFKKFQFAVGGVGPKVMTFPEIEKKWLNEKINKELLSSTLQEILEQIKPLSDVRGTSEHRRKLVSGLFRKFYFDLTQEVLL